MFQWGKVWVYDSQERRIFFENVRSTWDISSQSSVLPLLYTSGWKSDLPSQKQQRNTTEYISFRINCRLCLTLEASKLRILLRQAVSRSLLTGQKSISFPFLFYGKPVFMFCAVGWLKCRTDNRAWRAKTKKIRCLIPVFLRVDAYLIATWIPNMFTARYRYISDDVHD